MKYKVGDKFLQEIEIEGINEHDRYFCPYRMSTGSNWNENALEKLRRPDDMTAEEAWEIAREIACDEEEGGLSAEELIDIFGRQCFQDVLIEYTPQQAKAEIEAWEAKKEIKVGDVVRASSTKAVVLNIHDEYFDVLVEDGCAEEWYKSKVAKTGRHIDIQSVLEQIGGAE